MNVRHDAQVRVIWIDKLTKRKFDETTTRADLLDSHLTVRAWMMGGVSGMVNWHNPKTGKPVSPSYRLELVNPEDELKDGQLCTCDTCTSAA